MNYDLAYLVYCVAAAAATYGATYWTQRRLGLGRLAARGAAMTPLSDIASLRQDGVARVVGLVEPSRAGLIAAPISGTPCVGYELLVEEYSPTSLAQQLDKTLREREDRWLDFYVDDGTGKALVRTKLATMKLERHVFNVDDPRARTQIAEALRRMNAPRWARSEGVHVVERRLEPGQRVCVHGEVRFEQHADSTGTQEALYRESPRGMPVFVTPTEHELFITDVLPRAARKRLARSKA